MKNQVYIDRNFGWFFGSFDHNRKHRHYAVQLSVPVHDLLTLTTSDKTIQTKRPLLIGSNVVHQLVSDAPHFLLLVNPSSTIGHFWKQLAEDPVQEISSGPALDLQRVLLDAHQTAIPLKRLNFLINQYDCFCASAVHQGDERINETLKLLSDKAERVVSLEEVSRHAHLSPGRFLHLFKAETGITFRRAQLWNKLVNALPLLRSRSITESAYAAGFADGAHFSRVCKETLGFTPREFVKLSQFMQV